MKPTIWIFSLEPIESRYTYQWYNSVPLLLDNELKEKYNVVQINGIQNSTQVTPGAFLNFSDTNYWKSSQLCAFLDHYDTDQVSDNDHFLFTDAWNPIILQIKYMKDLLGTNWILHGLWHSGSYDPQDALGQLIKDKTWSKYTEQAIFYALDHNYFATRFHINMFCGRCLDVNFKAVEELIKSRRIIRTGWPMEYLTTELAPYANIPKRDLILFPHRISSEKQVDIFRDLARHLPNYEFVVCQDQQLTKYEYHTLLGQAKIIFSASLQETLGIVCGIEGPMLNAIPVVPCRLSYSEMFNEHFKYPSEWTDSYSSYIDNREHIIKFIMYFMINYNEFLPELHDQFEKLRTEYFTATKLIETIKSYINETN